MATFQDFIDSIKSFGKGLAAILFIGVIINLIVAIFRWKMDLEQVSGWLAEKTCEIVLPLILIYGLAFLSVKIYAYFKVPPHQEEPVTPPIDDNQDSGIGL